MIWIAANYLGAWISGWTNLARAYRADEMPPDAAVWHGQTIKMRRGSHFTSCVTVAANHSGVYFNIFVLMRLGKPPLFIPWSDIETKAERGFLMNYVRLSFRRASAPIILPQPLAGNVLRFKP